VADAVKVAMILGSGLGGVADTLDDREETPAFVAAGVAGHAGSLVTGRRGDVEVMILKGRRHAYEGVSGDVIADPIRRLHERGAEILVLTNAAGSLRPQVGPGEVVTITDHINLMGFNPLTGPQFVNMSAAYDPELRARLTAPHEGVYLAVRGPSFETPAEIRAFRSLGADLVGMSTVPETIVARSLGMRVVALSVVTNLAEGMGGEEISHQQTLANAARGAENLQPILERFLDDLA
jgi:xanthosine phosphorylase